MIVVLADDLTGAAELGGICLKQGLSVEVSLGVATCSTADVLVVSADSRSLAEPEALRLVDNCCRSLMRLQPVWMYKKIDSVLRGHVIAETRVQMSVFGQSKALLVPTNPSLGRTIQNGHYYLNDVPVNQTYFYKDPEYPISSSAVLDMLKVEAGAVSVRTPEEGIPGNCIVIGEANSPAELEKWARSIDPNTLIGGAAGFFTALLKCRVPNLEPYNHVPEPLGQSRMYVCGSAYGKSAQLVKEARQRGKAVSYLPLNLIRSGDSAGAEMENWITELISLFRRSRQLIVAIDPESLNNQTSLAPRLKPLMAEAIKQVLEQISVQELLIEGGATASAVLAALGVNSFIPVEEIATGVVRNRLIGRNTMFVTFKPGSYAWSRQLWID